MKANFIFFAAVAYIMVWLLACLSYSLNAVENTKEGPKKVGQMVVEFTNVLGMKFVLIPAGTFMMGSPLNELGRDSDEQRHKVTLTRPFYMPFDHTEDIGFRLAMTPKPR